MDPNPSDPLALIIAGGAAVISGLAGVVLLMISSRVKATNRAIENLEKDIAGPTGLFVRITRVEGDLGTAKANIESLKQDTLTKQTFDQSIEAQNRTLEELKTEGREVDKKVDRINYTLASRPWSQPAMPAARPPPLPREEREEDSDPPRPRSPSRSK